MLKGKFVFHFIACFVGLMIIVWLGTAFDNAMTFSWYSYTIVGILSVFYAWTKSVDMNKINQNSVSPTHHHVHHHPHTPQPPKK